MSPSKQLEMIRNNSNKLFMRARAPNQDLPGTGKHSEMTNIK